MKVSKLHRDRHAPQDPWGPPPWPPCGCRPRPGFHAGRFAPRGFRPRPHPMCRSAAPLSRHRRHGCAPRHTCHPVRSASPVSPRRASGQAAGQSSWRAWRRWAGKGLRESPDPLVNHRQQPGHI